MLGYEAKDRGHDARANVGKSHLDTNDGLRVFCSKVGRRGVDDAGVNWSTAKTYKNETYKRNCGAERQKNGDGSKANQDLA